MVRLDHLYVLLPVVFFTAFAALVPTPPNDFWWHLRIGQLIAEQGRVPTTTSFVWSLPADIPYIFVWLAEWLFYQLYQLGGFGLLVLARNLLWLATLLVIGIDTHWRTASWRLAGLAVTIAGALSLNNLIVRPQIFSWLPFVLTVMLLSHVTAGRLGARWLVAIPVLMVFWVNVHGAFILGLALVGAAIAGELIRWGFSVIGRPAPTVAEGAEGPEATRRAERPAGGLSGRSLLALIATGPATALATLINPYGLGIYDYVRSMTNHPNQKLVVEWLHPTPDDPINRLFYLSILAVIVVFATARRRPTPTELLSLCGLLWLAWSMQRSVTWFGLLVAPLLATYLHWPGSPRPAAIERPVVNAILAVIFGLPLLLTIPWLAQRLPLPATYTSKVWTGTASNAPLLGYDTPIEATEYLRRHPGGRLFNEAGYGSYLAWAVPDQPIFFVPQMEIYPFNVINDYRSISLGQDSLAHLNRYGVDRVLLSLSEQPNLSHLLANSPAWEREYVDSRSEIWRLRTP